MWRRCRLKPNPKVDAALALGWTMLPCGVDCTPRCQLEVPEKHTWQQPMVQVKGVPKTPADIPAEAARMVADRRQQEREEALRKLDFVVRMDGPNHQRDDQIRLCASLNVSQSAIARAAELSPERIRQIVKKDKA